MIIKALKKKWGMKKLLLTLPFVKDEFEPEQEQELDVKSLRLAIIDAATAYSIYTASLINYAIALKNGDRLEKSKKETKDRAKILKEEFIKCKIDVNIPTSFKSLDDAMTCLTQSPVIIQAQVFAIPW